MKVFFARDKRNQLYAATAYELRTHAYNQFYNKTPKLWGRLTEIRSNLASRSVAASTRKLDPVSKRNIYTVPQWIEIVEVTLNGYSLGARVVSAAELNKSNSLFVEEGAPSATV